MRLVMTLLVRENLDFHFSSRLVVVGEPIDPEHAPAPAEQLLGQPRADEAGDTRDDRSHQAHKSLSR